MIAFTIIKAGSTFLTTRQSLGDFEDWIIRGIGGSDALISVVNVMEGEMLPPVESLSCVIITGSHAMVTELQIISSNQVKITCMSCLCSCISN